MVIDSRELCPHCIDLTEVTEVTKLLREDANCLVEKIVRYCRSCNQELANTVTVHFKGRMG